MNRPGFELTPESWKQQGISSTQVDTIFTPVASGLKVAWLGLLTTGQEASRC